MKIASGVQSRTSKAFKEKFGNVDFGVQIYWPNSKRPWANVTPSDSNLLEIMADEGHTALSARERYSYLTPELTFVLETIEEEGYGDIPLHELGFAY